MRALMATAPTGRTIAPAMRPRSMARVTSPPSPPSMAIRPMGTGTMATAAIAATAVTAGAGAVVGELGHGPHSIYQAGGAGAFGFPNRPRRFGMGREFATGGRPIAHNGGDD